MHARFVFFAAVGFLLFLPPRYSHAHVSSVRAAKVKPTNRTFRNNGLKLGSTASYCFSVTAGVVTDPPKAGLAACVQTPTATAGLGSGGAKFNGAGEPQAGGDGNRASATNVAGNETISSADGGYSAFVEITPGPTYNYGADMRETALSVDALPGRAGPAGTSEAEVRDPIQFQFNSPDSIEFQLSFGDASCDTALAFQADAADASVRMDYQASYSNVSKNSVTLDGPLITLSISRDGVLSSPSDLTISFVPWSGLGLSSGDIQAVVNRVRSSMTVLSDGSIGIVGKSVDLIGPCGAIPSIELDAPIGTVTYSDYLHSATSLHQGALVGVDKDPDGPYGSLWIASNPIPGGSVLISYEISHPGPFELSVFDPLGRKVSELSSGFGRQGRYKTQWTGQDSNGGSMPPGLYFVRLQINGSVEAKSVVILR